MKKLFIGFMIIILAIMPIVCFAQGEATDDADEMVGYIYAYFRGSVNGEQEVQKIHLAISDDGLNWRDLNGNFPVLESTMGTKGLRDPYIIRSSDGNKFYLMATDLDSNGGQWYEYGNNGSKYLMFWESEDLVNWSEQRMVKMSDETMGCTWAPEAIFDEEKGEYRIYWASSDLTNSGKKSVYYATTKDFVTFTEPKVFVDGTGAFTVIDTTMVKGDDGRYYRFTKREDNISVYMEVADNVDGPYTKIDSNIESILGVEGPAIFKMIDGRYCLMLDGYTGANRGVGFFPLVTDDLASGQFTRLTEGYKMPTGAKHGVMLAITREEYDAVMNKWGPLPTEEEPAYTYTFENDGTDSDGKLHGNAKIEGGKLVLDGTSGTYFSLPNGMFDRRDEFTVSMDIKSNMEGGYFFTFAVGDTSSDYLFLRVRGNEVRLAQTISGNYYEEGFSITPSVDLNDDWHNFTIVGDRDSLTLYIDYNAVGSAKTTKTLYHLGNNLSVTLGKSTFPADQYFSGSYDNIIVYNRALTDNEVMALRGEASFVDGNTAYFFAKEKAWAIIAIYNEYGILTSAKTQQVEGEDEIEFTPPSKGKVRLMLWRNALEPVAIKSEKDYQ